MDALWGAGHSEGFGRGAGAGLARRLQAENRLRTEGPQGPGLWRPFMAGETGEGYRAYRLGLELSGDCNAEATLEIGCRTGAGGPPENAIRLQGDLRRQMFGAAPGWRGPPAEQASPYGRKTAGPYVHRLQGRRTTRTVLRHRARFSEGAGMYDREASVQARSRDLQCGGDPLMFCAITARQPWIDRVSDRFFDCPFEEAFRRSVEAFRARERLSARAFGLAALGDPEFIEGLLCGAAAGLRLDEVDTVLGFMGEAPLGPLFACEVDAFLSITRTGAERLGLGAVGEASFVRQLRAGHAPLLGTVDRVRRWMGMHSSAAQRRAIAAATLYPDGWRGDVADGLERAVALWGGHGRNRAGAPPKYVNTVEAAEIVRLSPRTLEYYRTTGQGPAYFQLGGRGAVALRAPCAGGPGPVRDRGP